MFSSRYLLNVLKFGWELLLFKDGHWFELFVHRRSLLRWKRCPFATARSLVSLYANLSLSSRKRSLIDKIL